MELLHIRIDDIIKKRNIVFTFLTDPFRSKDGFDIRLIFIFLLINCLVLINAVLHDPMIGYDANAHLGYIHALSQLRLVTPDDSYEFFCPPLPYAIPALLMALTKMKLLLAAKIAQLVSFFLSIGVTFYLLKACGLIGSSSSLKIGTLVFLGIIPVYYKTFAFVRGEQYIAFFAVVILYYTLLVIKKKQFTTANGMILGVAMGLCALSRQWGILLFPSVFLILFVQWIRFPKFRYAIAKLICLCLVLIFAISGWFYITLRSTYGSSTAFNRNAAAHFSFNNQPREFYFGLSPELLFKKPIRPNFPNQFIPTFYSELWGDYWGYFVLTARDTRTSEYLPGMIFSRISSKSPRPYWLETNYDSIAVYLGRVNLVSIFPSVFAFVTLMVIIMGILQRRENTLVSGRKEICAFLLLAIGSTMAGYFWFLIMYPNFEKGDTIKAMYVLQIFPFLAILVGIFIESIKARSLFLYRLVLGGFCLTFAHNLNAMLTHCY